MTTLNRKNFSLGWVPDADSVNAPEGSLLRADNLVLDELGVLSLRQGSSKVNSVAYADASAGNDLQSIFTAVLSGTRYRMTQVSDAVFANGTSIVTGFSGGDVQFGSYLGQILFARSTVKRKYDGTTATNWGISMTGGTPTVAVQAADTFTISTCDSGETNPWETATPQEGTAAFAIGQGGAAASSIELTPSATTFRAATTRTLAADTDFTAYTGGQTGTDDDLLDFYAYVTEPANLKSIRVMFDVNSTSSNPFDDDYYYYEWKRNETTEVRFDYNDFLSTDFDVYGYDRWDLRSRLELAPGAQPVTTFTPHSPAVTAGWNHFSVPRGKLSRVGSTNGRNWATVRRIKLVVECTAGGAANAVRFDTIRFIGGAERPLTGKYRYRYVYVNNLTNYQALSAPSAISSEIELKAQGTTVTVPADGSRDSQTDEIWVYRMGGYLDRFYRVAVQTGVSGTGAVAIDDELSDRDALITNIQLEIDNTTPPDNIIGIAGPYYDRIFCLTASHVYPSRRRNPDSFSSGQAIRIGAGDETCLWIAKTLHGIYIGTTREIYRLDGNGDEFPDGTIDFRLTGLNINSPPINAGFAQEGNILVYVAADGWRVFNGITSTRINQGQELLWRGESRHGVSAINVTGAGARFRGAITKGSLYAVTPEGSDTTSSSTLYRYDFDTKTWFRHTYSASFQSLFREEDGTLVAGDTSGFHWILNTGTQDDGSNIAVTLWMPVDDLGLPDQQKDGWNYKTRVDTGGQAATIAIHLDASASSSKSITGSASGVGVIHSDIDDLALFTHIQQRITGSFSTFKFYDYSLSYLAGPRVVQHWDTGPIAIGSEDLAWVREVRIKVRTAANLTVTPLMDGLTKTSQTYTVPDNSKDRVHVATVPLGREYKGFVPRFTVERSDGGDFYVYHMDLFFRPSGNFQKKRTLRVSA